MAKFDRQSDKLKARVQFVRGLLRKDAGQLLTEDEVGTMTDEQVDDEIILGRLEIDKPQAPEKGEKLVGK